MRTASLQPIRALSALTLLAVTAACNDSDGPDPAARVRFLHAAQGRAAIDFRTDGVTRGAGLAYSANWSANVVLSAGSRSFTARLTGGTTDLATTAKVLANSASYSVVLAKRPTSDTIVVYSDTAATPATDKAWIRLLNVSPAAGNVDVYVTAAAADLATATPQATDVAFLSASKYIEVASGAQRLRITTAGTKTVVLDINTIALTSRGVRSIALLDNSAGGVPLQSVTGVEKN